MAAPPAIYCVCHTTTMRTRVLAMVSSHRVPAAAAMPAHHCCSHRDADVRHAAAAFADRSVPTWQGERVADAMPEESYALCQLRKKEMHE